MNETQCNYYTLWILVFPQNLTESVVSASDKTIEKLQELWQKQIRKSGDFMIDQQRLGWMDQQNMFVPISNC